MSAPDERAAYAVAADLLRAARPLHHASLALLAATGLALALKGASPPLALSLAAGLAQAYLALRTALDAALFRRLADGLNPAAFDAAMTGLGLLPAAKAGRSAVLRAAGAKRLMVGQGIALALQALGLLAGALP